MKSLLLKHAGYLPFLSLKYSKYLLNNLYRNFSTTSFFFKQEELFPQRLVLPESHGYTPVLSPAQVTSMLTSNQATHHYPVGGPVTRFDSSQLSSNNPIEDRRAVGKLVQTGGLLFGVFDGHGGAACAQAVSERLFDYIALCLLSPKQLEHYSRLMRTSEPLSLLDLYRFQNDYFNEDLVEFYSQSLQKFVVEHLSTTGLEDENDEIANSIIGYLKTAFRRLDDDISYEAMPVGGKINEDLMSIAMSGSCCCTVHILGKTLHTANIGDCRAVVGSLGQDGHWVPKVLTVDHNVHNEKEAKRIHDSHPKSEWISLIRNGRLLSQLIPVRAFGDVRFKWPVKDLKNLVSLLGNSPYAQSIIPAHYYSPPYLIARPEVKSHELTDSDHFVIVASDGLWEMLSNEKAVEIVGDHITGKQATDKSVDRERFTLGEINQILRERRRGEAHRTTDSNGAVHLLRHALGYEHRKVSEMLTFPPQISRSYRDDITIIIVYFDTKFLAKQ
ncbi:hypothetical protein HELRODRAFT_98081 [Helobdella robusta]|uniref:PPM-type phosphatase domain-containing protein n=1 Tax=Helobdella robusta TaxID=6412 RepID=T1G9K4_HELRO|nr:hypothetical protein HELRODRAFT_98081 [Helobdella robusta]ESO07882.1 hypothetical protein HELRODRAFT_98081 [Helobdella robusta]